MEEIDFSDTKAVKLAVAELDQVSERWDRHAFWLMMLGGFTGCIGAMNLGTIMLAHTDKVSTHSTIAENFELQTSGIVLASICSLASAAAMYARSRNLAQEADSLIYSWAATPERNTPTV